MSPRTNKQYEEIREQSRGKIMAAALELFAKRGYHNTSITQIAKKAEVAKGLIYNYFTSKEDLLTAVVQDAMSDSEGILQEIISIKDPQKRLKFAFDLSFKLMEEKFEYSKLLTSLGLQLDQFPALIQQVQAKYKSMIPLLEHMLKEIDGITDYQSEAKILAAIFDGIGIQYIIMHEEYPLEEMKQHLYKRYGIEGAG